MSKRSPQRRTQEPARKDAAIQEARVGFRWPALAELTDPRAPYLGPLFVLLLTRIGLALRIQYAAEDAYITFRFARNFANGFGLVFNPGEPVFGFSSPLWTIWLGLGLKLGAAPVLWARLSTLALECVALVAVTAMLRRAYGNRPAWCFAAFFAAWPYFSAVSLSGMENEAMVGLIALAVALCAARNPFASLALAAVAWMRPEGAAAAAIIALQARGRDRWIALALFVASLIALALYFGSPIPQSVIAKSKIYGTPGPWGGRHWWEWISPLLLGRFPQISDTGHLFLLTVIMAPALWLGARALWGDRKQPIAAFVGACIAVWLGYVAVGVAYFWWYLAVPLAGIAAMAAVGFPRMIRGPALAISVGVMVAGMWTVVPGLYLGRAENEYQAFANVANYLSGHARAGQRVLLEPIGMIGFGAPVEIIDEIGLVSPEVAERRLQGPGWYADVVKKERPEWLVVRRGFVNGGRVFAGAGAPFRTPTERAEVFASYTLEATSDTLSGENALFVMSRRP